MPVSAADETQLYSYNGVILPALPSWNESIYPYVTIRRDNGYYGVVASKIPFTYYASEGRYGIKDTSYLWSALNDGSLDWYDFALSDSSNSYASHLIWTNYDLTLSDGSIMYGTDPVPVYSNITGRMVFGSKQVADDFASFVLQIADLSDTTAAISHGYKLYSGGVELRSVLDDESLTGSNGYIIHSTLSNLNPETEYEIIYTLYANGELTYITASTTFTTLATSGSGGGSDPDYSGRLDGIQQGIGEIQDSVDNVGSKVDGIQDTLTETKEEITSLPGKIAKFVSDMLIGLIVPTSDDLVQLKLSYEEMLGEKLGFVWQSFSLITTTVESIHDSMENGDVYEFVFPGVKLPMQGEEFVLVPETVVSLDNDLMDVLRPIAGTGVSIVAVLSFINMASDMAIAILSGISMWEFQKRHSYDTASSLDGSSSSYDSYSSW